MSITTTATTTSASATSGCHAKLYDIPTHDAACAMPMKSNYSLIMSDCCSSASVVEYDGCDYYCLAQDQSVGTLAECLIKAAEPGEVWCNTNANATATATATATGTGVVTLDAKITNADSTASSTSTSRDSTGTSTSTSGAVSVRPHPVSKSTVVTIGVLLVGSVVGLVL